MDLEFKVPFSRTEDAPSKSDPVEKTGPQSIYVEPKWACKPDDEFSFEVLKNGQIVETFSKLETKSCWSFGRLPSPSNDIVLAHPTISRFHAVMQYRGEVSENGGGEEEKLKKVEPGWYLYDLGSTHGTFINKQRVPVKTYVRMRVGYMLKMGASTRNFILLGPDHDEEDIKAESITEMKEQKQKLVEEMKLKQLEVEEKLRAKEEEGISWGMAEDAEDETDLSVNPFAVSTNEELFLDDPKKTLRGFFEREGLELEYKTEDLPNTTFKCRVELPIDDDNGRPIHAEVTHKGKKKECVLQCALEACRILDRHGMLRKANQEAAVTRRRKADSDSGDDDDFLDRTGDIERRKKRKTNQESSAVTFEELLEQEKNLHRQIEELEEKIRVSKLTQKQQQKTNESDDLDEFMDNLKQDEVVVDKVAIKKYRVEQLTLQNELKRVKRLIEITRPLELPKIGAPKGDDEEQKKKTLMGKFQQPLFGRKSKATEAKVITPSKSAGTTVKESFLPEMLVDMDKKRDVQEIIEEKLITKEKSPVKELPREVKETRPVSQSPPQSTTLIPPTTADTSADVDALAKKKSRSRIRIRKQVRDNVDMEETAEETEEKFTDWLPPTNQSGDGTTSLNDKLGY